VCASPSSQGIAQVSAEVCKPAYVKAPCKPRQPGALRSAQVSAGAEAADERRAMAGLCYAYAGIAHSYLTSDFNEGTSVPKGLVELDDLAAPSARASAADHDGSDGTAQAHSAAATTDGLLPDGAASLKMMGCDDGLFIDRRYVDTRVEGV
jgi:hypothetical protein